MSEKQVVNLETVAKVQNFLQTDAFKSMEARQKKEYQLNMRMDKDKKVKMDFIAKRLNLSLTGSIEFMIDNIYEALNN